MNENHREKLQTSLKKKLREDFIKYFMSEKSAFTIYVYKGNDYEPLIIKHFKMLNGKIFIRDNQELLIAVHKEDNQLQDFIKTLNNKVSELAWN
ncbi:hypothetical protein [Helicobacter cetorum]|uniref:Uncharacterized protein n=1 Tax=Helicobacter cetorum (strain ATCC BAA-429 / MIT 00-7128) TaxID=182217 RepID=I0ELW5_HELC0|nr:hypothetical protein [Helicobacter cetorum]AFI03934.1 hypothetical protein HCW_03265 [Helicobacter cetorum MIT 00-7128]